MFSSILSILLDTSSPVALFMGYMGVALGVGLCGLGSSYGTAKSGVGAASVGVTRPELFIRSLLPVIMSGMIGLYGFIIGLILISNISRDGYDEFLGFGHFAAGLTVGLSGLACGMCIGIVGDAGVRANAQQGKLFVGVVLMLVFSEALGLYGLIIGLVMAVKS